MKFYLVVPVLFLLFLASCSNIKNPEFRKVEQFRVKNVGLQEVTVAFNVSFFNPNNFGVTVKDAVADIYMDSVFLGKFSFPFSGIFPGLIYVNRKADFSIPLSGKISLGTALKLDLRNIGERKVFIKADGTARVGKAGIFVNKDFDYEGSHGLSEFYKQ